MWFLPVPQHSGGHHYLITSLKAQAGCELKERKLKRFAEHVSGRVLNCCLAPAWASLPVRWTHTKIVFIHTHTHTLNYILTILHQILFDILNWHLAKMLITLCAANKTVVYWFLYRIAVEFLNPFSQKLLMLINFYKSTSVSCVVIIHVIIHYGSYSNSRFAGT